MVEDGPLLDEVGAIEMFQDGVLQPMVLGQVYQLVCGRRVTGGRSVEVIVQSFSSRGLGHPRIYLFDLARRQPVLSHQHLAAIARVIARGRRIQLERVVEDDDGNVVFEPRERLLEPPFSDVAPRADDVGPDIDTHPVSIAGTAADPGVPSKLGWMPGPSPPVRGSRVSSS